MKTIVVTGTSSGIGNEICIQAAKLNYKVISISRNIEPLKGINGIDSYLVDITDENSIKNFIDDLRKRDLKLSLIHI